MANIFITGIGTEVGKTVASAIVTEALKADYFKPIQSGDLDYSDTDKVRDLISNNQTVFHKNSYALKVPASPHASAALEGVEIKMNDINLPETKNNLVIEGAGGLLVPLNDTQTIADLISTEYKVILVSRHYLGSINHTLLSIEYLKRKGIQPILIFNGNEVKSTEDIILKMSGVPVIGRIEDEEYIKKSTVKKYADLFREKLEQLCLQ